MTQMKLRRRQRLIVPIQSQDQPIWAAFNQKSLCMAASTQGSVEIAFARFGFEKLDDLTGQHRNMRERHLVTGSIPLPVVVKAFDGVLEGGVFFKDPVHPHHLENVAEKGAHAGELEITIEIS